MKFIEKNGRKAAAFDLIMEKVNALAIIAGTKTMEFRDFTEFYLKRLVTVKKIDYGTGQDIDDKMYEGRPVHCIHFHDYGNTWYLDIAIEAVDVMSIHPANREYFHGYNCHVWDALMDEVEQKGLDPHAPGVLWSFCMPVRKIIQTDLELPEHHIPIIEIPEVLDLNKN